jgi:transposase InsO family protein
VVHIAADKASLVNEQSRLVTIAIEDVLRLASRGEMRIVGEPIDRQGDLATQLLKGTSYESLEAALARYEAFCAWERGDPSDLSDRTARDWRQKIRAAEATYGWPALGLIHRNAAKGNRTPKADPRSVELAKTRDLDGYETPAAGTVYAAYGRYKNRCKKEHLQPVSLTKYQEIVKERKGEKQDAARFGHRYATQRKGPETDTDLTTPPNGDRVWEVAHIDHTPVDVETVSILDDEPLGTPWLSYMIDAFTRMILAMWLSFFRPSRIAVMMIMRDCVRRHNRLPDKIVVDRGAEFSSVYFDTLIAKANLKKFCRPKGEPRYGAVCERVFGTTNTRNIHEVIGNTKARRHGRGLSGTHDPKKHMIWTPDGLYDQLEDWSFETYPRLTNRNTTEAPRARMDRSLLSTGQRLFTAIPYNENFRFATMPEFPHQSTRTVRKGVVQIDKMDFRGRHESLVCFNGEEGPGRWEPMWPSTAFIELKGHSYELTCSSDLARELMENLSRASHMEVSARMRNGMRKYREVEPTLLDFLQRTASRQTEQANRWQAPVNEPVYPENEPSSARTGELRAPRDLAVSSIGEP